MSFFKNKRFETVEPNMSISFSPEEVVKVMSDLTVTVNLTPEEFNQFRNFVNKYRGACPIMKVLITDNAGGSYELTNFSLFHGGVNLMKE